MAKASSTLKSKYPGDGGSDLSLDRLAILTHKAHLPKLYKKIYPEEANDTKFLEPFVKEPPTFQEKKNPTFTFIDLFAGIGGFRIAGQEASGKCTFTSEWDKYARRAYFINFGQVPFGDITQFTKSSVDLNKIPAHDVLCGGFPCQAFSISGKQGGFKDPRGTLFFEIYKIAKHHRPKVLFLENVKNFAKHDNGNTFNTIKYALEIQMAKETEEEEKMAISENKRLKDEGKKPKKVMGKVSYVVSNAILNSSNFGASTKRERIYIVAVRSDLAANSAKWAKWLDYFSKLNKYRSASPRYLCEDIEPIAQIDKELLKKLTIKRAFKFSKRKLPKTTKPLRVGIIGKGGQGERIYSINGHAITFSAYGGGAASKTGAYDVDGLIRKLTPTECASAMGFHGMDVNTVDVPLIQRYKQFGNSVVVNVVEHIFHEIQSTWLTKAK